MALKKSRKKTARNRKTLVFVSLEDESSLIKSMIWFTKMGGYISNIKAKRTITEILITVLQKVLAIALVSLSPLVLLLDVLL